jgi:hypothetical protein
MIKSQKEGMFSNRRISLKLNSRIKIPRRSSRKDNLIGKS